MNVYFDASIKYLSEIRTWDTAHVVVFGLLVFVTMEVIGYFIPVVFSVVPRRIPLNPKLHYDAMNRKDMSFISFNLLSVPVFTYHMFRIMAATSTVKWKPEEATFTNTVLVLIPFFILYDFFYCGWHKFLHLRRVYGYIHKHHHKQISPTRGHFDAVNVHPVEFLVGEYLHALVAWLIPCHIFAVLIFEPTALLVATLNHTRLACSIPVVYDSKNHAVHHRLPDTNFGQYTMFWDKLFGWFHPYSENLVKSA